MITSTKYQLGALLSLCASIIAAPTIRPSDSLREVYILQHLNRTTSSIPFNPAALHYASYPSHSEYTYFLNTAHPRIEVRFSSFSPRPFRSETDVSDVFRIAVDEASNPDLASTDVPITTVGWTKGEIRLDMRFQRSHVYRAPRMKWGELKLALEAADGFRRAFPGVDYGWRLRAWPHWPRDFGLVTWGEGHLRDTT